MRSIAVVLLIMLLGPAAAQDHCTGCSCKCGPGYRLPTGRCASWAEHRRYMKDGGYPEGTRDELPTVNQPATCPAGAIIARRAAESPAGRSPTAK